MSRFRDGIAVIILGLMLPLAGSRGARADQCCYYTCLGGLGLLPRVGIVTNCVASAPCREKPRIATGLVVADCMPQAYKTESVSCRDPRSCEEGLHEGQEGEAFLRRLVSDDDVTFVRKISVRMRNGHVVKVLPYAPRGR